MTRAMALTFPVPDPPPFGTPFELAPSLLWLRLPLSIGLDHINLWLLAEADGWSLIDCGLPSPAILPLWEHVAAEVVGPGKLRRLLVTHHHPDHLGMAGWLTARFGVELEIPAAEYRTARLLLDAPAPQRRQEALSFYGAAGGDGALLAMIAGRGDFYAGLVPDLPSRFLPLRPGETIRLGGREWTILAGEGHAPEMAMLWCGAERILIAADQVLPTISPNIGVWPGAPDADPLARFLAGFGELRALPADTLVLPSHGLPFRGLGERLDEMAVHHDRRLDTVLSACAAPVTASDLLPLLYRRKLEGAQVLLGIAEAVAHLHYLRGRGELATETDAAGVTRFRRR